MELHEVHRDLLSFSERPEKPSSIKHGTNRSVLMFDQLLDSSGSESDIKINHVTHSRELNIKHSVSGNEADILGEEKRRLLGSHSLAHSASFGGFICHIGDADL